MNIIEELYFNNIHSKKDIPDEDLRYFLDSADKNTIELKKHLNKSERRLLLGIIDARDGILEIKMRDKFIDGWKLGAKFVFDTFVVP